MTLELQFEEKFFEEEVKCEYFIEVKQKKIWACELDLASRLIKVCQKYNIKIMAFAGTLLGAVRHQGFIPWDDDMDFCMMRDDFNRLLEVAEKEFQFPYFLQTALSDKRFFCGYARLRNSTTTGIIENHNSEYNCGIFIDIFVLDGLIEDTNKFKKQIRDRDFTNRIAKVFLPLSSSYSKKREITKKIARNIISCFTTYEKSVERYWKVLSRFNNTTDKVTFMTHPLHQLTKYWIYKTDFDEILMYSFENIEIPVPKNYDKILLNTYGDYMSFPPLEERGKWHQDQILFEPDISYIEYFKKKQC